MLLALEICVRNTLTAALVNPKIELGQVWMCQVWI